MLQSRINKEIVSSTKICFLSYIENSYHKNDLLMPKIKTLEIVFGFWHMVFGLWEFGLGGSQKYLIQ